MNIDKFFKISVGCLATVVTIFIVISLIDKYYTEYKINENLKELINNIGSLFVAKGMVDDAHKKAYVLDGTVPVLVQRTTMDEKLDVEAKSHVELFHHLFFTLAPDERYIDHTMNKAMYLVDETGAAQYNVLKEKGFFDNIIRSKSTFSIYFDSIKFDKSTTEWTYFGHQKIESPSNITIRLLVTSGKLVCVPTSENNPHGMIITNWRILENYNTKRRNK